MSTIESAETGSETANHEPQSSGGSIAASAIRFCGDEIGELCPPMFAASAMPSCARRRGQSRGKGGGEIDVRAPPAPGIGRGEFDRSWRPVSRHPSREARSGRSAEVRSSEGGKRAHDQARREGRLWRERAEDGLRGGTVSACLCV